MNFFFLFSFRGQSQSENREKFEKNLTNYTQNKKLLEDSSAPLVLTENKYEKDEELLRKYENECRFGTTTKHSYLLGKSDMPDDAENDEDTMQGIDYFKFRSNFINTANSIKDGTRASSSLAQRMKNDFSKNEEDDEDDDKITESGSNKVSI